MIHSTHTLRIPVFPLSGFLGSGKTTLLNRVLKTSEFALTAVVINEFGEIGLDHLIVARGHDNVVLLEAGCLCCTIADSLHETLGDLHARRVRTRGVEVAQLAATLAAFDLQAGADPWAFELPHPHQRIAS